MPGNVMAQISRRRGKLTSWKVEAAIRESRGRFDVTENSLTSADAEKSRKMISGKVYFQGRLMSGKVDVSEG